MSAGQIADAHQKLAHDLPPGEAEGLLEELDPFLFGARVMRAEPAAERSIGAPKHQDPASILDRRIHFQPIPNDPRISQQPGTVRLTIGSHDLEIEAAIRSPKRISLLENGEPRETRLIDFQD